MAWDGSSHGRGRVVSGCEMGCLEVWDSLSLNMGWWALGVRVMVVDGYEGLSCSMGCGDEGRLTLSRESLHLSREKACLPTTQLHAGLYVAGI